MVRNSTAEEKEYMRQARRARRCGIDAHFELMTHWHLFDFVKNAQDMKAPHEGLWLYEPAVTVAQYEGYFGKIIAEGEKAGLGFTGMTWPGCSCPRCNRRYAQLRKRLKERFRPNPNMWQALLNLAKRGKFEGRTVPTFFDSSETDFGCNLKASDGKYGVYDLMPNAGDWLGSWGNGKGWVKPDYYITPNGKAGVIVRHLERGSAYCLFYAHWQGLNPGNGYGWAGFTTVVERVRRYLRGKIEWVRPAQIAQRVHA